MQDRPERGCRVSGLGEQATRAVSWAMRRALRTQKLGSHRTRPQSRPRLRPPSSLSHSRSLRPRISALWGSEDPMAWFRDGCARGHASKWAGAQEGRQPLTPHPGNLRQPASLGGSARSRQGPARFLPAERMRVGAGDRRAAACTQPGPTRWGRTRCRHHHREGSLAAFGVLEPQGELTGKRRGQESHLRAEITKPRESARSMGRGVRPQEPPWERKEGRCFPSEVRRQGLR